MLNRMIRAAALCASSLVAAAAVAADPPPTGGGIGGMLRGAAGPPAPGGPPVAGNPAAPDVPAAAWIKPGMRISHYTTSGTFQYDAGQIVLAQIGDPDAFLVRDPNDPNRWLCIKITSGVGRAVSGATGYTQTQIVAMANGKIYVGQRVFNTNLLINPQGFAIVPVPPAPIASGGGIGWQYVGPTILNGVAESNTPPTIAHKGTVAINGEQVHTLLMQDEGGSRIFNLDTGILISMGTHVETAGNFQNPHKLVSLGTAQFKGVREIPYPWLGMPLPGWARTVKSITYRVESVTNNANTDRFVAPQRNVQEINFQVTDRGPDWLAAAVFQPGQSPGPGIEPVPNTYTFAGPGGGPGAIILPPDGFAALKEGQVLDTDPVVGLTLTVAKIGRVNGVDSVVFVETTNGLRFESRYDRATGALLSQTRESLNFPGNVTHVQVTRTAVQ